MASPLDFIEKTFFDYYRKEIDQEENIWRTLPFFAAAIAVQFGVLSGLLIKLPAAIAGFGLTRAAIVAVIALDGLAPLFLARSISSRKYHYLPDETTLLS